MGRTQEDLYIVQLTYFFLTQFGYRFVLSQEIKDDIWLCSYTNANYPMIRISKDEISETEMDLDRVFRIQQQIIKHIRRPGPVLDIHITGEEKISQNDQIFYVLIKEGFIDNRLISSYFPGIENVLRLSDNPEADCRAIEDKILAIKEGKVSRTGARKKLGIKNIPRVTTIVMAICVLIFLVANYIQSISSSDVAVIFCGGLWKSYIYGANEWWRLLVSGFLHTDIMHLAMNMVALYNLGPLCENIHGKGKTVVILLVSIIFGSFFALITSSSWTVTLGISGGIYGLMAAVVIYLVSSGLIRNAKIRNQFIYIIVMNFIISIMPGISGFGHLGGAIGGLLMSVVFTNNKPSWKKLKMNSIVAGIGLFVFFIYFALFLDKNVKPITPNIDYKVVNFARDNNLDWYADYLDASLQDYYRKVGE